MTKQLEPFDEILKYKYHLNDLIFNTRKIYTTRIFSNINNSIKSFEPEDENIFLKTTYIIELRDYKIEKNSND